MDDHINDRSHEACDLKWSRGIGPNYFSRDATAFTSQNLHSLTNQTILGLLILSYFIITHLATYISDNSTIYHITYYILHLNKYYINLVQKYDLRVICNNNCNINFWYCTKNKCPG